MVDKQLTLQESLRLLEITNLDGIKEGDLTCIRRKAQKRWHPDTIAYTRPSAETLKRYEQNFSLIDVAIAIVEAYLKGDLHTTTQFSEDYKATRTTPPQETIRQNASVMQETLRNNWSKIKKIGYKSHEETVILSEGVRIRDLLKQDLKDKVPVICIISLFNGTVFFLLISIIFGLLTDENPFVMSVAYIIWCVQASSCVVGFLPLSRFWLPTKVSDFVAFFIKVGIYFQIIILVWMERCGCFVVLALPMSIAALLVYIVELVVLYPIYGLFGLIIGEHKLGKIQERIRYYAGFADWYIEADHSLIS